MISLQALKDRLHVIAREKNLPFNACWKQFLLERFLARLAASTHSSKFIFKGGFLLSYIIDIGRETADLDFLLTRMKAEEKELQKVFEQIITIYSSDGFDFAFESIEFLNQPHMNYHGYRVILNTTFANTKDKVQVDIGVGDVVDPLTFEIPLIKYRGRPLFENTISILVYPVETIFSEKLETILSRGAGNSRMKDYHDLILMIRNERVVDADKLKEAMTNTFSHRGTTLKPIQFEDIALKDIQKLWTAHLRDIGDYAQELNLPKNISLVIDEVNKYVASIHSITMVEKFSLGAIIADMEGNALIEKVKKALASGADINDDSRNGHRPLQLALAKGHSEVARLLIEHNADLYHRDKSGKTPLQAAINNGQFENAKLMIKKGVPFNHNNLNLEFDYTKHYQFIVGN